MEYVVKVSRKGQIVIPVEIRRKLGVADRLLIKVEENSVKVKPYTPLEKAFGADGKAMIEVAKSLLKDKEREIKLEK